MVKVENYFEWGQCFVLMSVNLLSAATFWKCVYTHPENAGKKFNATIVNISRLVMAKPFRQVFWYYAKQIETLD